MAKFCLLAERILPNFFLERMKVGPTRIVCLHGMCKVDISNDELLQYYNEQNTNTISVGS